MNDQKVLYVHIGHYKTGTTALQDFFHINQELLKEHGVNYCSTYRYGNKHSKLAFSVLKDLEVRYLMHGFNEEISYLEVWENVFKEVAEVEQPISLVSSEELIRLCEFKDAHYCLIEIAKLAKEYGIEIKVVSFFRDAKSHILSWYNQLIKMRLQRDIKVGMPVPALSEAMDVIDRIHYDYELALSGWIDAFGKENVQALEYYARKKPENFIFRQFVEALELEWNDEFVLLSEDPNPRLDSNLVSMLSRYTCTELGYDTFETILHSFRAYNKQTTIKTNRSKEQIHKKSENSETWLKEFTQGKLDFNGDIQNMFEQHEELDEKLSLLSFVYYDMIKTRQTQTKRIADLERIVYSQGEMIKQLEQRVNNKEEPPAE